MKYRIDRNAYMSWRDVLSTEKIQEDSAETKYHTFRSDPPCKSDIMMIPRIIVSFSSALYCVLFGRKTL